MMQDISVALWWRLMVEKLFTNKIIVITGATKGIGLACAERSSKRRRNNLLHSKKSLKFI